MRHETESIDEESALAVEPAERGTMTTNGAAPESSAPDETPSDDENDAAEDELLGAADAEDSDASDADTGESESTAGRALSDEEVLQSVAALIYASPDPLSERRIAALLEGVELPRVRAAIEQIRAQLAASGLPYEVREIAGGIAIMTSPSMAPVVQRLIKERKAERISAAALETLAVIAYRQPVTKAEIEAIRGVQAGPMLRTLVDRGLVRVTGRAEVPGHPLQYGTTKQFLDQFGLGKIEDLPRDSELAKD
ncbi:MAG: SMC-Scp complex subunit ScpB [Planctomycetota bacterium]